MINTSFVTFFKHSRILKKLTSVLLLIVALEYFVSAETYTWNDTVINGQWNEPTNWAPQGIPTTDDIVQFTGLQKVTVTLQNNVSINTIIFASEGNTSDDVYNTNTVPGMAELTTLNLNGYTLITNELRFIDTNYAMNDAQGEITGGGILQVADFDMPDSHVFSITIAAENTLKITDTYYGNTTGSMTYQGDGTLYVPASGANVNYGASNIVIDPNLTVLPITEDSPFYYIQGISNLINLPDTSATLTCVRSVGTGGGADITFAYIIKDIVVNGGGSFEIDGVPMALNGEGSVVVTAVDGSTDFILSYNDNGGANPISDGDGFEIDIYTPDGSRVLSTLSWYYNKPTWVGNVNNLWENENNWVGIPVGVTVADLSAYDIKINYGCANYPTVNSNVKVKSLILTSGALLTMESGVLECNKIEMEGNSHFYGNGGTVTFVKNGIEEPNYVAEYSNFNSFYNVTVASDATLDITSELYIAKNFTSYGSTNCTGSLIFNGNQSQSFSAANYNTDTYNIIQNSNTSLEGLSFETNATITTFINDSSSILVPNANSLTINTLNNNGIVLINSSINGVSAMDTDSGTFRYNGTLANIKDYGADDYYNLEITGGNLNITDNLKCNGNFSVNGGTFNANETNTIQAKNIIFNGGTSNLQNSLSTIDGSGAITFNQPVNCVGNTTFITDEININESIFGTNEITIKPFTPTNDVTLGGNPDVYYLDTTELVNITAQKINIQTDNSDIHIYGNSIVNSYVMLNATGSIIIEGNASFSTSGADSILSLQATNTITAGANSVLSSSSDLSLLSGSGTGVVLGNPIRVGNVTGDIYASALISGDINLYFTADNTVIAGTSGISAPNGDIQLESAGALQIVGNINSNGNVSITAGGLLSRTAGTITAPNVQLQSAATTTGIGTLENPIITACQNISASTTSTTTSNGIFITNSEPATVNLTCDKGQIYFTNSNSLTIDNATTNATSPNNLITLVCDSINLHDSSNTYAVNTFGGTGGTINFIPYTEDKNISLGTVVAGSLSILQTDFDKIEENTLIKIGKSTTETVGNISVNANMSWLSNLGLNLTTGGAINGASSLNVNRIYVDVVGTSNLQLNNGTGTILNDVKADNLLSIDTTGNLTQVNSLKVKDLYLSDLSGNKSDITFDNDSNEIDKFSCGTETYYLGEVKINCSNNLSFDTVGLNNNVYANILNVTAPNIYINKEIYTTSTQTFNVTGAITNLGTINAPQDAGANVIFNGNYKGKDEGTSGFIKGNANNKVYFNGDNANDINTLNTVYLYSDNYVVNITNLNIGGGSTLELDLNITINFTGEWRNNVGDDGFEANTSTLKVKDNCSFYGNNKWYNFDAQGLGGKVLRFEAGKTQEFAGYIKLSGTDEENHLIIQSDSNSDTDDERIWYIRRDPANSNNNFQFLDVEDSTNTDGENLIYTTNCTDLGCNVNWIFPGQEYIWQGGLTSFETEWDKNKNWLPKSIPGENSIARIPDGKDYYPILTSNKNLGADGILEVYFGAQIDFAGCDFTANKIENNGRIKMFGENIITAKRENGNNSVIEYYDDVSSVGTTGWGNFYNDLDFSNGAKGTLSSAITVNGNILIYNGSANELILESNENRLNLVTLGNGATNAGSITINGSNDGIKMQGDQNCSDFKISCPVILDGDVIFNATSSNATSSTEFNSEIKNDDKNYTLTFNITKDLYIQTTTAKEIIFNNAQTVYVQGTITTVQNLTINKPFVLKGATTLDLPATIITTGGSIDLDNFNLTTNYTYINAATTITAVSDDKEFITQKDLIINLPTTSTFTANTPIKTSNFVLYNGTLQLNKNLKVQKDFLAFGENYDAEDPQTEVSEAYAYEKDQTYATHNYPTENLPEDLIVPESYTGKLNFGAGVEIDVGKNFYVNGITATSLADCTLKLAKNKNVTSNFSVAYNSDFSDCKLLIKCNDPEETAADSVKIAAENTTVQDGYKSGWDLDDFIIEEAYTVYDNLVYVKFNRDVRSAKFNDNINKASVSDNKEFTKVYKTITSELGNSDITDVIYLENGETWNTDATGESTGQGTDTNGEHQSITPYLNIPRDTEDYATFVTDLYGKRLKHYSNTGTGNFYTDVIDKCGPVLIKVRTGQELHTAYDSATGETSQHSYDAHNFIEFEYSEAVDFGSSDSSVCDVYMPALDVMDNPNKIENVQVSSQFGAIEGAISSTSNLSLVGLAVIENGQIYTGSENADNKFVNALYRSEVNKLRYSVAGFTNGTVQDRNGNEYKNWVGYIKSGATPSGKVTLKNSTNDLVKDLNGNSQITHKDISVDSTQEGEYGSWDVSKPTFAPLRLTAKNDWSTNSFYEAIGVTNGVGTTLERLEFHIFDNTPEYSSSDEAVWLSERGWVKNALGSTDLYNNDFTYACDIVGGARAFAEDSAVRTLGGIRFSSKKNAHKGFMYVDKINGIPDQNFQPNAISYVGATATIFTGSQIPRHIPDDPDGLYFGLELDKKSYALTTSFTVSYDDTACFITDLAGNLLNSDTINTIDRTPPSFNIILGPINQNKMYVVFVKELETSLPKLLDSSGNQITIAEDYLHLIPKCFEIISLDANGNPTVSNGLQIDSSVPAQLVTQKSTEIITTMILTLNQNITLSDIENLYIRLTYSKDYGDTFTDPVTGLSNAKVTVIQDKIGNYMGLYEAHALSEFAINAINPLYAYDSQMLYDDNPIMDGLYSKDTWAVHNWDANQQNYGTLPYGEEITLVSQWSDGIDSESNSAESTSACENVRLFISNAPDSSSLAEQYNADMSENLRIWLPAVPGGELYSFALKNNTNYQQFDSSFIGSNVLDGFKFVISPENMEKWSSQDQLSFLFGLLNTDLSQKTIYNRLIYDASKGIYDLTRSNKFPLYALRLSNPSDISSIDLWSFKVKATTLQRGGVTILNNVINATKGEKTVIKVNLASQTKLDIMVMTLDGNVVKYLNHGTTSKGEHYFSWDGKNKSGKNVARGLYFVRIIADGIDETRKVMVVKD